MVMNGKSVFPYDRAAGMGSMYQPMLKDSEVCSGF